MPIVCARGRGEGAGARQKRGRVATVASQRLTARLEASGAAGLGLRGLLGEEEDGGAEEEGQRDSDWST